MVTEIMSYKTKVLAFFALLASLLNGCSKECSDMEVMVQGVCYTWADRLAGTWKTNQTSTCLVNHLGFKSTSVSLSSGNTPNSMVFGTLPITLVDPTNGNGGLFDIVIPDAVVTYTSTFNITSDGESIVASSSFEVPYFVEGDSFQMSVSFVYRPGVYENVTNSSGQVTGVIVIEPEKLSWTQVIQRSDGTSQTCSLNLSR